MEKSSRIHIAMENNLHIGVESDFHIPMENKIHTPTENKIPSPGGKIIVVSIGDRNDKNYEIFRKT